MNTTLACPDCDHPATYHDPRSSAGVGCLGDRNGVGVAVSEQDLCRCDTTVESITKGELP